MQLRFRTAQLADQQQIKQFECADPVKRKWDRQRKESVHPAIWEFEAQSLIRTQKVRVSDDCRFFVAVDSKETVRAVCFIENKCSDPDYPEHYIGCIAVQNEAKNSGVGGQLLDYAMRNACSSCGDSGLFTAKVVPENLASEALLSRKGFFATDFGDETHREWMYVGDEAALLAAYSDAAVLGL